MQLTDARRVEKSHDKAPPLPSPIPPPSTPSSPKPPPEIKFKKRKEKKEFLMVGKCLVDSCPEITPNVSHPRDVVDFLAHS
jgi:hypothetical protein